MINYMILTLLLSGCFIIPTLGNYERVNVKFDDKTKVKMFTKEELKSYGGEHPGKPIYLAILGEVFDVSNGVSHYGKAGGYHGFAGRDGTRAFVVGGFTEKELIEDVLDLTGEQALSIYEWLGFYRKSKEYFFKGKLIGFYYDSDGNPTPNRYKFEELCGKGNEEKLKRNAVNERYPPCNSQTGTQVIPKVWCTNKSGGIERSWVGVPRKFRDPTLHSSSGEVFTRCACVPLEEASDATKFQSYPKCKPTSSECLIDEKKDDL
ncbi:hypothetical protein RFI_00049 [Reticulomyxa filosa]|uniref:Cytochrome b5 heme-binding domain-containing protein n=1 Tax=Reticulomyxa filosa TaxID=46433 RepID=X6PFL7_RETFI|nr:hypothetical protein RFI_00049 [Reticulomyxa filosa]|eukprot:ETO37011.1 hypothetical protein RFI_00049 [Reticulomyxa filosa]